MVLFPMVTEGPSGTGSDRSSSVRGPQVREEKEPRGGIIWEGAVFLPWCLCLFLNVVQQEGQTEGRNMTLCL